MQKAAVLRFRLECMADCVTQIQHAAQSAFVFVGGNDFRLQFHRLRDQPLQFHRIAFQNLRAILFEAQEQLHVSDDAALQRLVQPGAKLAVGQASSAPSDR